jgi:hypothetical protein
MVVDVLAALDTVAVNTVGGEAHVNFAKTESTNPARSALGAVSSIRFNPSRPTKIYGSENERP